MGYYDSKQDQVAIDKILKEMAGLFANCEKGTRARDEAKELEIHYLEQINAIDEEFARSCGYRNSTA